METGLLRLATALLAAASLAACSPTGPTAGDFEGSAGVAAEGGIGGQSTMRWQLEDGCSDGLGLWGRFFDETAGAVWPNAGEVYSTTPAGAIDRSLSCVTGHKICYGAQPADPDSISFWGVGVHNDKGCDTCCFTCQTTTVARRPTC
jgi:hypothetical protein